MLFSGAAIIDKKTINGDHAQTTVTGDIANSNQEVFLLNQKYVNLLEERIKDKDALLEGNQLTMSLYQERIASLEEEVEILQKYIEQLPDAL